MINYNENGMQNFVNEKITEVIKKLENDFKDFFKKYVGMEETPITAISERLLNKNIKFLRLHPRTYNYLNNRKINTIKILLNYSENDLVNMPYLGKKSIEDIKNSLGKLGITLQ